MSKYDCSKTADFLHELNRKCESGHCDECPYGVSDNCMTEFTDSKDEAIGYIQKWSDENPEPHEKTILEDFIEKYPNADINYKKMPLCCEAIYIGYTKCHECGYGCKKCWDRPLSEMMR